MNELQKLTLFYDGTCPLCKAEILFLGRRNQAGLLEFLDINSAQFDPSSTGVSCELALASMYGQYADGTLINGISVFSEAYKRANLPLMSWLFSRKILQPFLKLAYRFFARHRHKISGAIGPFLLRVVQRKSM